MLEPFMPRHNKYVKISVFIGICHLILTIVGIGCMMYNTICVNSGALVLCTIFNFLNSIWLSTSCHSMCTNEILPISSIIFWTAILGIFAWLFIIPPLIYV